MNELITTITVWALPVLLAITLHEAAHGYAARAFGDRTAEQAGRISLNPLRHIDPVGTIAVPLAILALSSLFGSGGMLFGWAKPVPVNFNRLRNPKADMLWVAAAGPFANLLMGIGWALLLRFSAGMEGGSSEMFLMGTALAGISINGVLMMLNLLPLPPLDGGRIMVSLLPHRQAWQFARLEPYGMPILLVLLFTGALSVILGPLMSLYRSFLSLVTGF